MDDALDWLTLLERIMRADSLATAGPATVRGLAAVTGASATGLFVVLHDRMFFEFWHPDETFRNAAVHDEFRRLALLYAARASDHVQRHDHDSDCHCVRSFVFPMKNRLAGVLCMQFPAHAPPDLPEHVQAALGLVALQLTAVQEIEAERTKRRQYEHWFHTSDRHIRTLEAERQKFAALVTSTDSCVFVADRGGVIRWTSRPLQEHVPPPSGAASWSGRPCDELCTSLGGGTRKACGECILTRAANSGQETTSADARVALDVAALRMTALPIKDAEGRAHEVMVVLEGMTRAARRNAA
jgi:hypothetical protein